jgi:kumamolisin
MAQSAAMKTIYRSLIAGVFCLGTAHAAPAWNSNAPASLLIPDSSVEHPGERGHVAHTNHAIRVSPEAVGKAPKGETPASLACVYKTAFSVTPGCGKTATINPIGGSGTIAIVDAFDYPTAESDLNAFSNQFGLPSCTSANGCFRVVYGSGSKPKGNCGWNQEAALDIEWAHAMAPSARIVLVEANSSSFPDLLAAVDAANAIVTANGGTGQVSMSWGGSEFSGEINDDSRFTAPGVVYFASSGDTGGVRIYPGTSPNVVSAGGTTILRDGSGNFFSEVGWSGSGGGPSQYEYRPAYQDPIAAKVGMNRGAPDLSFDADPNSGVSVYDTTSCQGNSGWMVFGGTSVAAPSLAGIVNLAGNRYGSTAQELGTIYGFLPPNAGYSTDFRDVVSGTAGKFKAGTSWDFVTGVGSSLGLSGK